MENDDRVEAVDDREDVAGDREVSRTMSKVHIDTVRRRPWWKGGWSRLCDTVSQQVDLDSDCVVMSSGLMLYVSCSLTVKKTLKSADEPAESCERLRESVPCDDLYRDQIALCGNRSSVSVRYIQLVAANEIMHLDPYAHLRTSPPGSPAPYEMRPNTYGMLLDH